MSVVTMERESLQKLVKRDVALVVVGSLIALWTYSLVAAVAVGAISSVNAGRVEVGVAVVVSATCVWWWAAGPREMMLDRVLVLIPVFLVAGPGLIGVHNLGGGVAVGIISGAVGFAAACAFGLLWGGRKSFRS